MHQHQRAVFARRRPHRQDRIDRRLNFMLERKSRGHHHRLAGGGHALHQRRPGHFSRRDLEDRRELIQEVDVG